MRMIMYPNKYIIQTDSNSYFKGHGKKGAVFTNNPKDALVFDNGEDATVGLFNELYIE